jgi:hypothetical protein
MYQCRWVHLNTDTDDIGTNLTENIETDFNENTDKVIVMWQLSSARKEMELVLRIDKISSVSDAELSKNFLFCFGHGTSGY